MKPFNVILQVRQIGSEDEFRASRSVPVYATDEEEAIERASRVLEFESYESHHVGGIATEAHH